MSNAALSVSDVSVEYRKPPLVAVDGVSLTVNPGEVVALVGESGCGKSSLARAVVGIESRSGGQVSLNGQEIRPLGLRRRVAVDAAIQMVFQDPSTSLNLRRTVGDQLKDGINLARARGMISASVEEWLERVGLDPAMASRYPQAFSGGQKQRIAIARALAARPSVLVADEPISALDASTQMSVASLMRSLCQDDGAAMLFISHDLSVVRRIADRLCVMYRGRFVETGDTQAIWDEPRHPYTQSLLAAIPAVDGLGTVPVSPSAQDRAHWSDEIPEALDRVAKEVA
ncbi:ABC transporter ATP-binding protein [Galactobacter sp.]|uniref:ABC transporter ATP-binding protein n=1 Tax=Galactobacter sp. TaxID=2676125 RepID=UPI0025BE1133|nr:ATP-binding cassette domain-containing protein [Galactobacter sp.]